MSDIYIKPSQLNGAVTAPPSKSDVHRAIICAALSRGRCKISPVALSKDIEATIGCIKELGARAEIENGVLTLDSTHIFENKNCCLYCCESGSTLRFLIPVAAAQGVKATFTGSGLLPQRPIGIYLDCLPKAGVKCTTEKGLPLTVEGQLQPGKFEIPGNVSSQFITGLLLALPLLNGDSEIIITSPLESAGYVDMTVSCMAKFGVTTEQTEKGWYIRGNQRYTPINYTTQGDWSQAAFFMTAAALTGDVTVKGVDADSPQGDKAIARILKSLGAFVAFEKDGVRVKKSQLTAGNIDAKQIPDLVPILAVAAVFARGTTVIYGAERLRIKESDRLRSMADAVNALGGKIEEKPDGLVITGVNALKGGKVQGENDHRIVMAMSVAALRAEAPITITDRESINKSYPDYFKEYIRLGGKADVNLR